MDRILLYHTGFEEIRSPDVLGGKTRTSGRAFICHRTGLFQRDGRKNARAATP